MLALGGSTLQQKWKKGGPNKVLIAKDGVIFAIGPFRITRTAHPRVSLPTNC
jgi:hypothetical protein